MLRSLVSSRRIRSLVVTVAGLLAAAPPLAAQAHVLYVDQGATGLGDGSSWTDAFTSLHDALAASTQPTDQIWVAEGVYLTSAVNDPDESFWISRPVQIYGGFDGTETALGQQNPDAHPTTLSGAIGGVQAQDNARHVLVVHHAGPEPALVDGFRIVEGYSLDGGSGILSREGDLTVRRCKFLGHVTEGSGAALWTEIPARQRTVLIEESHFEDNRGLTSHEPGSAVVSSVALVLRDSTFTNNGSGATHGGALTLQGGGCLAERCEFIANVSADSGGAVLISAGLDPQPNLYEFVDCTFRQNQASWHGGAIHLLPIGVVRALRIRDCEFVDNVAGMNGGAIHVNHLRFFNYAAWAPVTIDRCVFLSNVCQGRAALGWREPRGGGAVFGRFRTISNSLFAGNVAEPGNGRGSKGGAIATPMDELYGESDVVHCTIVFNRAYAGGGGVQVGQYKRVRMVSCILWGNQVDVGGTRERQQVGTGFHSRAWIQYSAIEGLHLLNGRGNTGAHPAFVNPAAGDFRLLPQSPLIDRGCPFTSVLLPHAPLDLDLRSRIQGPRADMGAYEVR